MSTAASGVAPISSRLCALSARAVLIGRPVIWGLTVHGADGVRDVLEHLRVELVRAMQLTGTRNTAFADVKRDLQEAVLAKCLIDFTRL